MVELTNSMVVVVASPGPHSSYFGAVAGTVHSICPPRRLLVPITFKDTLTVTASTGLLNVILMVPPQNPTGFPLESIVGHSDRGTPVVPLAGLIETTAKGLGLEVVDCEPQPATDSNKITIVIVDLVGTDRSLPLNRFKFNSNTCLSIVITNKAGVVTQLLWATFREPDAI